MRTCSIEGCGRKHAANGVCLMHYKRFQRYGSYELPKRVKSFCQHCDREVVARGLCDAHYQMWKLHRDPLYADKKRAEREPTYVDRQGYLTMRGKHPVTNGRNTIHRIVTDAKPGQIVHHIDGDKLNNAHENLYVCDDRAAHLICHRSLETLGFELVRAGVIVFDHQSGSYKFAPQST
jgi:hypothetical protein